MVPSFMKGQQKLVNALIASLSRRLPVPDTRLGEGEFTTGDNVMAWWEEDRCWFRAIGCWRHTQTSPPLSSSWTGHAHRAVATWTSDVAKTRAVR